MDIYLSVNNRADILQIPVLPAEYTISKPQGLQTFETVSKGELQLIGTPKLKSITIKSFFPVRDYPYLRDTSMKGQEYIYKLDTWIAQKLPIRLIITDTPINMVVAVKNFQYTTKTDGDLWYTLELEQFNLLGYEYPQDDDEEIDMEELNRLKDQVEYLTNLVEEMANPMIYNYIDENMPEWARESVQKLLDAGIIKGTGEDSAGSMTLGLDYLTLRLLVIIDRAMQKGAI